MNTFRLSSALLCASIAAAGSACGGDTSTEPLSPPGVHAVSGAALTDSVEMQLAQPLVVAVYDSAGRAVSGTIVRFESQPPDDTSRSREHAVNVCRINTVDCEDPSLFAVDTTDARGHARAVIRLGSVAGRAVVRVSVPELGYVDSVTYTATPRAAARLRVRGPETGLDIGSSSVLRSDVIDVYANTRPEHAIFSTGPGTALTIDPTTGVATGREFGDQWIYSRFGTSVDSTKVHVVPAGRLVVYSTGSVLLVNVNGTSRRTLMTGISNQLGVFPRFDPSRQRVSAVSGEGAMIVTVDTITGSRRNLPTSVTDFTVVTTVRQMADGTLLVVALRNGFTGYAIWRVATDNSVMLLRALPDKNTTFGGADFTPDGTRVAYLANPLGDGSVALRVMDVATGVSTQIEPLTSNPRGPRWSPAGDKIAFTADVPDGGFSQTAGAPVVMNADGTGRRMLGRQLLTIGIAWSPDGAYLIGRDATPGLRIVRVSDAASVTVRTTNINGNYFDFNQPDWR